MQSLHAELISEDGKRYTLSGEPVTLGRSPHCDITLDDGRVSGTHARFEFRDGALWVIDENSTNGVYVNEQRIEDGCDLQHGDLIRVGRTTLEVRLPDPGMPRTILDEPVHPAAARAEPVSPAPPPHPRQPARRLPPIRRYPPPSEDPPEAPHYSTNIWDYVDFEEHGLPSFEDRQALVDRGDAKRVMLWDYFFRVPIEDLGKPQKEEINHLNDEYARFRQARENDIARESGSLEQKRQLLSSTFSQCDVRIAALDSDISKTTTRNILIAIFLPVVGWVWLLMDSKMRDLKAERQQVAYQRSQAAATFQRDEADANRRITGLQETIRAEQDRVYQRISALNRQVDRLMADLPPLPSDEEVYEWLEDDLARIQSEALERTSLGTRLIDIAMPGPDGVNRRIPNPIRIIGPAMLQDENRLPRAVVPMGQAGMNDFFDEDRFRHFHAGRAFETPDGLRVVYAVYYVQYILVADDMLATYEVFHDAITGTTSNEYLTEQYYTDVVAIALMNQDRILWLRNHEEDALRPYRQVLIENAPTFNLSLKSNEHRTVTFMSEDYFRKLGESIPGLPVERLRAGDSMRLLSAQEAADIAGSAVRALRFRLRKHKGLNE